MTLEQLYDTAFAGLIPRCCHGHLLTPGNLYHGMRRDVRRPYSIHRCKQCQADAVVKWRMSRCDADRAAWRAYHRDWMRERRALLYLHRAIAGDGREVAGDDFAAFAEKRG